MLNFRSVSSALAALFFVCRIAAAAEPAAFPADQVRFFEMKIRPVLATQCAGCHQGTRANSGFSIESRESVLHGGNRGPAVKPGEAKSGILLDALAQTGSLKMPPGGKLKPEQIEDFRQWVAMGAPWAAAKPMSEAARKRSEAAVNHWSFKAPARSEPPAVKNPAWPRNAIDRFLLARMEKEGLSPAPQADRRTLIRRLSLDLLGLPPTPQEVEAFVNDQSANAYEKLVDRTLASPHYGERWGRHWLDVARYADTNGFGFDNPRVMWRYRDWVIQALNRDLPFDQFVIEQLAGDLIPNATVDQKVATGFHRNTMINQEGGVDQEQYRIEALFDRVATTGSVFLGLTVACTQCHDHKYDPLTQREYYQLMAFFNNQEEPVLKVVPKEDVSRYRQMSADYEVKKLALQAKLAEYDAVLPAKMKAWEASLTSATRAALPGNVQEILALPLDKRELPHWEDLEKHYKEVDAAYQKMVADLALHAATPHENNPSQFTAMVLEERDKPRKSYVLIGGDFLRTGVEVFPQTPAVLPPLPENEKNSWNRMTLAKWLVNGKHPLTGRVMVNRMWQYYFGKGLVKTSEDFGTQGDPPTHPELLDYLATEFVEQKWSMKAMHRLIVTSAMYQQSSRVTPELLEKDPENLLHARAPRFRVEAEVVRDISLAASGLLNLKVGGPSVFPPQPPGITDLSRGNLAWVNASGADRYRRGMYTFWKRTSPYPAFTVFDSPTADMATIRRNRSNSPMQALTILNEELFAETAEALGKRVLREAPADDRARLEHLFRLCLARAPDGSERDALVTALENEKRRAKGSPERTWFGMARIALNLDETITRE